MSLPRLLRCTEVLRSGPCGGCIAYNRTIRHSDHVRHDGRAIRAKIIYPLLKNKGRRRRRDGKGGFPMEVSSTCVWQDTTPRSSSARSYREAIRGIGSASPQWQAEPRCMRIPCAIGNGLVKEGHCRKPNQKPPSIAGILLGVISVRKGLLECSDRSHIEILSLYTVRFALNEDVTGSTYLYSSRSPSTVARLEVNSLYSY